MTSVPAWVRTLGGLVVSGLFLALASRRLEWAQFARALSQVSPWMVLMATVLTVTSYLLRGVRWRRIFPQPDVPTFSETMGVMLVGYAANNVLPARAGEVLRAHLMGRRLGISRARVLATVVVERAADALSLVVLFMLAAPLLGSRLTHGREILGLGLFLGLVVLIMAWLHRRLHRPGSHHGAEEGSTFSRVQNFLHGLQTLGSARATASLLALSMGIWLIDVVAFWAILRGFPLVQAPFGAALSGAVFGNLGTLIPAGPAGVGTYELAVREAVTPWGIDPTTALAVAVVSHLLQFVLTTGTGALAWVRWDQESTHGGAAPRAFAEDAGPALAEGGDASQFSTDDSSPLPVVGP